MKRIQLSGPKSSMYYTLVSIVDFDFLSQYSWHLTRGYASRTRPLAERRKGLPKTVYMHLVVAERAGVFIKGMEVDHRNLRPLDNRRRNLRPATRRLNQANAGGHRDSKSGLKGVTRVARVGKWRATLGVNGKQIWLGYHPTKKAASKAYSEGSRYYNRNFSRS